MNNVKAGKSALHIGIGWDGDSEYDKTEILALDQIERFLYTE